MLSVAWAAESDAGKRQQAEAGTDVIVVVPQAALGVKSKTTLYASAGEILRVGRTNGAFLWIPRRQAWIQREDVMPLAVAIRHFTQEIEKTGDYQAYMWRGMALAALGKLDSAIDDLNHAIELNNDRAALWINRGNVWRKRGDADRALADYEKALALDPENLTALGNRGMLRVDQGDYDQGITDLSRAIELGATTATLFNERGVAYRQKGNYVGAVDDYTRAIELDARNAKAYANRGFALKQLGRFNKALNDYEAALKLDSTAHEAHNDLAWLLATCPDKTYRNGKEAIRHATIACQLTQYRRWQYIDTLAAAYAESNDFDSATKWARQCIEKAPEDRRAAIQHRIDGYEQRKPVRDDTSANT